MRRAWLSHACATEALCSSASDIIDPPPSFPSSALHTLYIPSLSLRERALRPPPLPSPPTPTQCATHINKIQLAKVAVASDVEVQNSVLRKVVNFQLLHLRILHVIRCEISVGRKVAKDYSENRRLLRWLSRGWFVYKGRKTRLLVSPRHTAPVAASAPLPSSGPLVTPPAQPDI